MYYVQYLILEPTHDMHCIENRNVRFYILIGMDVLKRYSQLSKYTGQGCPQNETVAPGHSTRTYHPTSTVNNNTMIL